MSWAEGLMNYVWFPVLKLISCSGSAAPLFEGCLKVTPASLPSGSGGDPAAEGDHGDPEGPHEAAAGAAGQGGQASEGEAEAAPAGGGERGLRRGAGDGAFENGASWKAWRRLTPVSPLASCRSAWWIPAASGRSTSWSAARPKAEALWRCWVWRTWRRERRRCSSSSACRKRLFLLQPENQLLFIHVLRPTFCSFSYWTNLNTYRSNRDVTNMHGFAQIKTLKIIN